MAAAEGHAHAQADFRVAHCIREGGGDLDELEGRLHHGGRHASEGARHEAVGVGQRVAAALATACYDDDDDSSGMQ